MRPARFAVRSPVAAAVVSKVPGGKRAAAILAIALAAGTAVRPEDRTVPKDPPPAGAVAPHFPASAEEVRVDLVVRDKRGALVRDLTLADLEVYEDGARQEAQSLQLVLDEPLEGEDAAARPPAILAFVFDRLSPAARSFTREGLLSFLAVEHVRTPRMAVLSIEGGLRALSPLTDDKATIRRAADTLLGSTPRGLAEAKDRQDVLNAFAGMVEGIGQSYVAPAELAGVPECRGAEADQVRQSEFLAARMAGMYQSLERNQQGHATLNALLALVATLQALPGRKAVVLFSEGLSLPGGDSGLRSLVSAANRAGVSIYGADASGLRAASETDETKRTIDSIRARLRQNVVVGPVAGPGSSVPMEGGLHLLERNEDALRQPAAPNLGALAEQTGGFLAEKTNDLAPALLTAAEDLRERYVLSYAPRNRTYDGGFRSIEVKVKRPFGRVQARRGYLAVRTASAVPVLAHEAQALARLESDPRPGRRLPLRVRGLHFPGEAPLARVPVFVEIDAASLISDGDRGAGAYRWDFTVLVLARDEEQRVAAKMSQRYTVEGRLEDLEAARSGRLLFSRETSLPPGLYTLEAIVYDHRTGDAGITRATLEVPASIDGHLRASSLVLVDRAETRAPRAVEGATESAPPAPALRHGDLVLFPNVGQPLRRAARPALAFAVTARPSAARTSLDAQVEVLRDGQRVAAPPAAALKPDPDGQVRLVSSLPMDLFRPGRYEIVVTLSDGQDAETRSTTFPIVP
jgi:VWFA-related protein